MFGLIKTDSVSYDYIRRDEEGNIEGINRALSEVNIDVKPGEFITILGHNGSGKSTLAKHLNALLQATEGTVYVEGKDVQSVSEIWNVRQTVGMVFQNPDNQIVAPIVEEDVAFGPENMGIKTEDILLRVEESLKSVDMYEFKYKNPNNLSGGQKQRVSIAGVLAMHPKCIVFDEPTAMLDPSGRKDVIRAARDLNKLEGITVILITHYMEEAIYSDRIFVMDKGKVVMSGSPREIFADVDKLTELRLGVPQATLLANELKKHGVKIPDGILDKNELIKYISNY